MKTKLICMLTVAALLVTISGTAQALTVPSVSNGWAFVASRNVDNGSAYLDDRAVPTYPFEVDPDAISPDWHRDKSNGAMAQLDPPDAGELEDTWGLGLVYQMTNGLLKPDGTVQAIPPGYYDNSFGTADTWVVGMFWGGNDALVTFEQPTGAQIAAFSTETEHVHMELWAVEKTALDSAALPFGELLPLNVANRTAVNRYDGWMEDSMLADGTAVKLLSATSTFMRFDGAVYTDGKFDGESRVWWDVDSDDSSFLWNPTWGLNPPTAFLDPLGNMADMYMSWDLEMGTTWDTISRDFGGVHVIPEPVTMLGVFLGLGSLSGYIRKRKMA